MAQWKIMYTDRTTISSDEMIPEDIPNVKRAGVHSIAQAVDENRMRETLESPYYGWSKSRQQWIQLNIEDVFDWLLVYSSLDDLGALLMGRIQTYDEYNAIRMEFKRDPDIVMAVEPSPVNFELPDLG